jgi:hypothetical protein
MKGGKERRKEGGKVGRWDERAAQQRVESVRTILFNLKTKEGYLPLIWAKADWGSETRKKPGKSFGYGTKRAHVKEQRVSFVVQSTGKQRRQATFSIKSWPTENRVGNLPGAMAMGRKYRNGINWDDAQGGKIRHY